MTMFDFILGLVAYGLVGGVIGGIVALIIEAFKEKYGNRQEMEHMVSYLENAYQWGWAMDIFETDENSSVEGEVRLEFVKGRQSSFVCDLVVSERSRNKGIGSSLLDICEKVSMHNGRDIMELEIEADDTYAQKFYEKRGYSVVDEFEREYGRYKTMRKHLDRAKLKDWDLE